MLAVLGRRDEAHAIIGELSELKERRYVAAFFGSAIYGALGMEEECRRGFARMEEERSGIIAFLGDPAYDSHREWGWFQDLLRRVGVG